ncbi:MAG: hypothetical protein KDA57_05850 [Planctomycetales bacterium]|nr:hypothetical protein [Planctomycetales bacterium]
MRREKRYVVGLHLIKVGVILVALASLCWNSAPSQAQISEFNGVEVPGTVVAHIAASNDYKYNSPSIAILPDGTYLISHDVTGNNAPTPKPTYVHRSTDQGQTWNQISTVNSLTWANLYNIGNDVYLMGNSGGSFVIYKSTDGGVNWTSPVSSTTGRIGQSNATTSYHTGPMPLVEHDGRLWRSIETRIPGGSSNDLYAGVMSIAIGDDLLDASNWTFSNRILSQDSWLPGNAFNSWREGNVVVDRDENLVNLIRVDPPKGSQEVAAIMRVQDANTITFDPNNDIIDFNGGAKKFTIRYDAGTDRYWTFANIITPYNADPTVLPSSHRNIVALVESPDLRNWDVNRIVVQDLSDMEYIGFQYWDWQFEGADMVAASRTAYPDGLGGAIRFHDANFITFHRVEDFATKRPTQSLVADTNNNRVMRYELTETNQWMPVGQFELGNSFAGTGLNKPMGLAKDSEGHVYIGEQTDGGRVLRFDSSGNFLNVIATEGVGFTGRPESLVVGPTGDLYMSVAFGANSDKVYKIDPSTGNASVFIDTNFSGGSLNNPRAIAFGDDGNLYVADRENNVFRRFDGMTGAFLGDLYTADNPEGLVWDEFQSKLIGAYRDGGDANLVELGAAGGASTLYNVSDIGRALGIVVIEGDIYWSDWDNGKVYKLKGTNMLATSLAGLSGPGHLIEADPIPIGERSWTHSGSSNWSDWNNWTYWSRPDSPAEVAMFGSAISSNATIALDATYELRGLRFRDDNRYTISGAGQIILESEEAGSPAILDVQEQYHYLDVDVLMTDDVHATMGDGARLYFEAELDLGGNQLFSFGPGRLWVSGDFVMNGGRVVVDGQSAFSFGTNSNATLDGDFQFIPDESLSLALGQSFDLLNGVGYLGNETFDDILLPALPSGLVWDLSSFYNDGIVTVAAAAAGDFDSDGDVDADDLAIWQSNFGMNAGAERTNGDADEDGDVDGMDLLAWQRQFTGANPLTSQASSQVVPEPGATLLFLAHCAAYVCSWSRQLSRF